MKTFIWNGDEINVGRFGLLKKNDLIRLTDQEQRGIEGDPRFVELKDPKKAPKPGHLIHISDKLTGDQQVAAKKANTLEVARLQRLQEECGELRMAEMEIKNKTYDQLLSEAQRINRTAGKEEVRADDGISRGELIIGLMNYLKRQLTPAPAPV